MNDNHKCFGCRKQIGDMEPHIHLTLDEWGMRQGLESLGLGDLLKFAFCEDCTETSRDGWTLEQHEIGADG